MKIEIIAPISGGVVKSVASKSQAHRMLICAALADNNTYIKCSETSDDIDATVSCLVNLGASISYDGKGFSVEPIKRPISADKTIVQYCNESGSTLRFMLPVCCALGVCAEFIMEGQLAERPMAPLVAELTAHGCEITKENCTYRCSGKLHSGVYEISGNISSQFISGLLIALSLLDDDSALCVAGREESRPYIAMTLETLSMFGIKIKRFSMNSSRRATFGIIGSQGFKTPAAADIEGDWSNAAFWLCAGAIRGTGITCTGLNLGSNQGDMAIVRLLERFGANVSYEGGSVTVTPAKLHGLQIDAIDTPDLVPVLSVVAAVAEGETVIFNAKRLKMKESNRLHAVANTLHTLGAEITGTQDGLIINGKSKLQGGTVSSFNDHRIAMMAAIASIACENPVTINDAEAVNKSYPGFFKDFQALGGSVIES